MTEDGPRDSLEEDLNGEWVLYEDAMEQIRRYHHAYNIMFDEAARLERKLNNNE